MKKSAFLIALLVFVTSPAFAKNYTIYRKPGHHTNQQQAHNVWRVLSWWPRPESNRDALSGSRF